VLSEIGFSVLSELRSTMRGRVVGQAKKAKQRLGNRISNRTDHHHVIGHNKTTELYI
jgi:hypothetical protein